MRASDGSRPAHCGTCESSLGRARRNSHEFRYSLRLLAVLAPCALVGCSSNTDPQPAQAPEAVAKRRVATDTPSPASNSRYLGPSTCASVGCHGFSGTTTASATPSEAGLDASENDSAWRTAYWIWKSDDPHAQAYDVLWRQNSPDSPNSIDIVRQLDPQAVSSKKQYLDFILKNCCGCHATGVAAEGPAGASQPPDSLAMGVHCEACHGPARDWVKEHTLVKWVERSQVEQEAAGHRTTRDLTVRAGLCVECHIGSTEAPGQEVNHDLIAAGHPRLSFEYSVFLDRMPKHWGEKSDRTWAERPVPSQKLDGRRRTNFELEVWHAGQLVSARQALRLLAGRAQKVANGDDQPWPEFSEFDCFACHHELKPNGFRQKSKNDGVLVWTNWYTSLSDQWLPPTGGSRDSLAQLQGLLEERSPPPKPEDVAKSAEDLSSQLAAVLASRTGFATPKGRSRLAKALASDKLPEPGWMDATQWMLAVTACVRSFDAAQVEAHAAGFESHLEALEDRLAFSPGLAIKTPDAAGAPKNDTANNTVNNAEDDMAENIVNSPRMFDPTDPGYRDLIVQIRKDLEKLAGAPVPNNPEADK